MLPSANNRAKLALLRLNLDEQYQREQILWKQKSRDSWLIQKELNTKFFYTLTIIRRKRNSISSIKNSDHLWVSSRMDIENLFVLFYKDMFNSSSPSVFLDLEDLIPKVISSNDSCNLTAIPLESEILVALNFFSASSPRWVYPIVLPTLLGNHKGRISLLHSIFFLHGSSPSRYQSYLFSLNSKI